ncbi:hypothetical protein [Streptomyces sp. SJL17-1]|uniref:hypothetical protein n=1 Tax=Streptomyces sp. SJL17-1 TaxID=2967223 RepID=UPI0029674FDE|nr:hypothetical protein [Streptomyces sp. SJL17-1]
MHQEKTARPPEPEGCLTAAIRIPVRIVVLVLVVPLRLGWDALVLCGAFLGRMLRPLGRALGWFRDQVLAPVGRAVARVAEAVATASWWLFTTLFKTVFYWPWLGLWRYVLVPVAVHGIAAPAAWLYRTVLAPLGRGLARGTAWVYVRLLAPLGRGTGRVLWAVLVWPWTALWRYVTVPVATWTYRWILTPLGHALSWLARGAGQGLALIGKGFALLGRGLVQVGRGLGWLLRVLFVVPVVFLYRWVLTPLGHALSWLARGAGQGLALIGKGFALLGRGLVQVGRGLGWLLRVLFVVPVVFLYRWVLTPVGRVLAVIGRELADALAVAWRVAGYISRAVGRALKWLARNLIGRPVTWFYRNVCTPVGHLVRDAVWRPARKAAVETGRAVSAALASARATVAAARRDAWRALFGGPREPEPVPGIPGRARNLGGAASRQTVPGAAAESEISLHKGG